LLDYISALAQGKIDRHVTTQQSVRKAVGHHLSIPESSRNYTTQAPIIEVNNEDIHNLVDVHCPIIHDQK